LHGSAAVAAAERLVAETADTYPEAARGEPARRAPRHIGVDVLLACALVVGPLAVVISRLDPGVATAAAAMPLIAVLGASIALGDVVHERDGSARRRRFAMIVMAVAIVSMFLIVRAT